MKRQFNLRARKPPRSIPEHHAEGESAGYAILFAMCGSAYVVAFLVNHVFAPRFEPIRLRGQ